MVIENAQPGVLMLRKFVSALRHTRRKLRAVRWVTAGKVSIFLGILAVIVMVKGSLIQHGTLDLRQLVLDLWSNLSVELASIVITVLVIDTLNRRRHIAEEKQDLILQMGSPDNAFALEAVRKLRARGWLQDGSLQRARLERANLQCADLTHANLHGAYLVRADLREATLYEANLSGAILNDADLGSANLTRADLYQVRLTDTLLRGTDLSGASLWGAAVVCHHDREQFDETTILPDHSHWTETPDGLDRFTDPAHEQFWRSSDSRSPAFKNREGGK
jgi:hypothetical protein